MTKRHGLQPDRASDMVGHVALPTTGSITHVHPQKVSFNGLGIEHRTDKSTIISDNQCRILKRWVAFKGYGLNTFCHRIQTIAFGLFATARIVPIAYKYDCGEHRIEYLASMPHSNTIGPSSPID